MANKLMLSTQISCHLAIVTVTNDRCFAIPVLPLTTLFYLLWQLFSLMSSVRFELMTLTGDIFEALTFTLKVFVIGFSSLAFGLGVTI